MNEDFLKKLINTKKTCYFVSPHLDDAIFSSGGLISYLSKHKQITVINVFTKAGGKPDTLSAKRYLQLCGYKSGKELYSDREQEDNQVLKSIGVKVVNLGFTEALWREKPKKSALSQLFKNIAEFSVIYPTYRFHILSGKISPDDAETLEQIKNKLKNVINDKDAIVFCPASFKGHIDHIITRTSCEQFANLVYWSDSLHFMGKPNNIKNYSNFSVTENLDLKQQLVQGYKTQFAMIFKDKIPDQPEVFFVKDLQDLK